jgi:spindle assembly abnormal protein 6
MRQFVELKYFKILKELIIKLTDEFDPLFLYSLYMGEEDFQALKIQQGILVDFSAFGQRFVDLLHACEKDDKLDHT